MAGERMSLVPQDTVIPVDGLTFLVPSRTFRIEGTLLKGGYVSLATEFALRLLRDAGELPPAEVGAFFGFSERETRALIQELLLDGYILVWSDRVRLSQRGEDAFNPITGDLLMLNIEPFGDTLSLDLVSFAPIDATGGARMPWLSEVEIPDKPKAAAATEAGRHGFRSNFGEWRERRFKGGAASTVRLQSIDEITPLGRGLTPVTVPVSYAPTISDLIEPDFSGLRDRGRRGSREKLVDALSNVVRGIIAPGDHLAAADATAEWDRGILKSPASSTAAGVLRWLQVTHRGVPELPEWLSPSIRLAGSMTFPATASRLFEFIETAVQSDDDAPPVFWLPAEHAAWGRSATLTDVVREMNSEITPEGGIVLLPRADIDDRSRRELVRQYGGGKDGRSQALFGACVAVPPDALPLSLELVVQPTRWAVVLIHVPAPKTGFPVPIGYASTNSDVVDAISTRFAEAIAKAGEASVFWARAGMAPITALEEIRRHLLSTV
ncbi:MAG: hypothetical protein EOQ86_19650 [Mesorhizobium sp.]|uniref:hypothetical protein n=1 Tax=Mesorhizobium sp. TaxID=1871066 RepID=UPI000FEA6F3E|nr:hypothetical protein [Mesorhizobium sp.]RWH76845.1 MAG: hypothetical protein EOQ85_20120 [Mesorhizobium sp.]RWH80154.1 MAG: hypothetical protein EOQ86_19650 [Mesorhizobium sp.]RWH88767.1 MAG: hypothetical protein EOQ87_20430 [Mesorhizobium sp.]RWH95624.1 MAG: hypothetical protein EOQ88_22560 [Mesorhizobium sp.]RWI01309.1 MAG: hypothetical protein EOQ89_16770 [Mesorhizobium sp.]